MARPTRSLRQFSHRLVSLNIHLICPNCDAPMLELSCKLLCQSCGYFMGCSDYV